MTDFNLSNPEVKIIKDTSRIMTYLTSANADISCSSFPVITSDIAIQLIFSSENISCIAISLSELKTFVIILSKLGVN